MLSRRRWVASVVLALTLATAVMLWAGLQWTANFDSDEAVFGLMARHSLQGNVPTYRYGLAYLGSLESLLAAATIFVLGPGVLPPRLSSLALYLVFLLAHALLTKRAWGTKVSAVSTLLLALPARWVLEWVYRPMGFSTILPFGTIALLLASLRPARGWLRLGRAAAIGALAGLAMWSNPSGLLYFAVLAVVAVLGSEEWRRLRTIPDRPAGITWAKVAHYASPVLVLIAALLALTAVFADGCDPGWTANARASKAVLAVTAVVLCVALIAISRRRSRLAIEGGAIGLGLLAGSLPVWRAWVFYGVPLARAIMPSCPAEVPDRADLVFHDLLPALAGSFRASYLPHAPWWQACLWVVVAAIGVFAAIVLVLRERTAVADLLRAMPVPEERKPATALLLLFALPVLLAALGSNTMDLTSTRYLMISWHAGTVVLALLVARYLPGKATLRAMLVVLWVAQVVLVSYRGVQQQWNRNRLAYGSEQVAALESYLDANGVSAGYAGYWTAFALDYLWEERIVLAPFSGSDRYPAYGRIVAAQPVQAYIMRLGDIAAGASTTSSIVAALEKGDSGGGGHPDLIEQVQGQTVLKRQRVGNWDVWLVTGRSAVPATE